ncbi:hypothetical protein SAMN04488058_11918 [Deinococcus reticulitermitis]|uniref:CGNR zinc finger domain-containing protein n=1 Tax=Deinococcus reticulitermitis TaxID=856736 RepID=A0A1H7BRN6_9DEIO|nr:CGNR zinc finger domain-containing protein [Deinococcus reticulitermitis]SEJ79694.1 hypothetical protein SAMN04488058_11918 [Deinococcus reticulitermitis]
MSDSISIFCHWSAQFSVEYVPPASLDEEGQLRFTPVKVRGKPQLKEWFTTWHRQSLTGKPLPELLNALLPLAAFSEREKDSGLFTEALLDAARQLGPLFTALPWHGLNENAFYKEPVRSWHQAAQRLAELGGELGKLSTTSRDGSKTARKRRAVREAEAVYGEATLQAVSAEQRRTLVAPYRPSPGIAPIHDLEGRIGAIMDDLWIIPLGDAEESDWKLALPRLRLSEGQRTLQLNVPFGLQALLIMMVHDQRLGHSVLLRTCKRPDCRVVRFMQPRQLYCSPSCQNAAAVKRHREKGQPKSKLAKVSQND